MDRQTDGWKDGRRDGRFATLNAAS